jgi:hypothetical protein
MTKAEALATAMSCPVGAFVPGFALNSDLIAGENASALGKGVEGGRIS